MTERSRAQENRITSVFPASRTLQNSLTLSGPKVTSPGPRGLGCTPSTASLVVGSDQSRSMSTRPPSSIVSGRVSSSIWSMLLMERPMPAGGGTTCRKHCTAASSSWEHSLIPSARLC